MRKKKEKRFMSRTLFSITVLIVILSVGILSEKIMHETLEVNTDSRVLKESCFLVKEQSSIVDKKLEEQFASVQTIVAMVEQGLDFSDKRDQKILEAITIEQDLCMLGIADGSGNVINYRGEEMGNISDRQYFTQVWNDKKESVCEYLGKPRGLNEPRLLFSAPIHKDDTTTGVLFFSKEIGSISWSLFKNLLFGEKTAYFIVDNDGQILVSNNYAAENYHKITNIADVIGSRSVMKNIMKELISGKTDSKILSNKKEQVIAYSPVDTNGWNLVCIVDKENAREEYATGLNAIRRAIIVLSILYAGAFIYFAIVVMIQIRSGIQSAARYKEQNQRITALLKKTKCVVSEYDVKTDEIRVDDTFEELFGCPWPYGFLDQMLNNRERHPEFDYNGLKRELNYVIRNKETTSFETVLYTDETSFQILSIVMIPILDENQNVVTIIGGIRESDEDHQQLKGILKMINQVPGGIYRYYLGDPVYLEYASEGLCRMLGYTLNEFILKAGMRYTNIILEEDWPIYDKFVEEAMQSPGVRSCEYRVVCKDGTIIPVRDTMESMKNESDTMYGFSAVTDVSEYEKRQTIQRQELEQLEAKLEQARIKNSTSQMQPHFLYNALASIREIILEDPQYASDLLCDFTIYLRACVNTMQNDNLISMEQEIKNINAYVNIEKMRMGDRLHVEFDIQAEEFEIVPLSIQPLVENAIRHGIFRRGRKGGTVWIKTETLTQYHVITVKDDGVGFDYQKVREEIAEGVRDSTGLDNVILRLTKQLQAEVIIQSECGTGTTITVKIPGGVDSDESDHS